MPFARIPVYGGARSAEEGSGDSQGKVARATSRAGDTEATGSEGRSKPPWVEEQLRGHRVLC